MLLSFALPLLWFIGVVAQPATLQWNDCFTGSNTSHKLNLSTVYAQVLPTAHGALLNLTVLGETPQTILESSSGSNPVASKPPPPLRASTRLMT